MVTGPLTEKSTPDQVQIDGIYIKSKARRSAGLSGRENYSF